MCCIVHPLTDETFHALQEAAAANTRTYILPVPRFGRADGGNPEYLIKGMLDGFHVFHHVAVFGCRNGKVWPLVGLTVAFRRVVIRKYLQSLWNTLVI